MSTHALGYMRPGSLRVVEGELKSIWLADARLGNWIPQGWAGLGDRTHSQGMRVVQERLQ